MLNFSRLGLRLSRSSSKRCLMLESLEDRRLLSAGTSASLVADIFPGAAGSNPTNAMVMNNNLYFAADDGVHGTELYKSDGSAAGTVLLKDINPGSASSNPNDLTPVGNTLYFRADDGAHGQELWKSDGTPSGTVLVKDINPGSAGIGFGDMADINATLFFSANDGAHGAELYKSDGTANGTVLVKDINSGRDSSPAELTNVNGVAFFTADNGKTGRELWKSNGTAKGTVLVKDIWTGTSSMNSFDGGRTKTINSSSPQHLTNVNGTLFFVASDGGNLVSGFSLHLYKSDGTANGTVAVAVSSSLPFVNVNGTVFFRGDGGYLWKTDGTTAGTVQVSNVVQPTALASVNGTVFFSGHDSHGAELWKTDGTQAGTLLVKDINSGADSVGNPNSSSPAQLTNDNGLLYFAADDGVHGRELWQSDGTEVGTAMVQDINPNAAAAEPQGLIVLNNTLYFSADDGTHGRELWDPPAVDIDAQSVRETPPVTRTVPFTGRGSGAFTDASGDFLATGTATHLGAFTHYGTLALTPTNDPFVLAVSGKTVYKAANGDLLYADTSGTLNVLTGIATGTDTWEGGTGRFADASGIVNLSAQLLPDGTLTFALQGGIAI